MAGAWLSGDQGASLTTGSPLGTRHFSGLATAQVEAGGSGKGQSFLIRQNYATLSQRIPISLVRIQVGEPFWAAYVTEFTRDALVAKYMIRIASRKWASSQDLNSGQGPQLPEGVIQEQSVQRSTLRQYCLVADNSCGREALTPEP